MAASSNPTPLHNVPVEIIQEIIVHAIRQPSALNKSTSSSAVTPNHELNPHPYSIRAALLSVCKTWRRLVFNTPRMWNVLVFDGVLPPSLQEVEIWLKLSKACPLDVYICLETWFPIPREVFVYRYTQSMVGNPRDLERVYEMLGGHMDRIRTLVMDLRHCRTACFPPLNGLFPVERVTKMKRLETFECIGASVGPIGRLHAPQLKKLKTGFNLNVMLERMTMDTVLAVREMEVRIRDEASAEQIESLGLYRNLQRLHIIDTRVANVAEDAQRVLQSDKVPLPRLRSLTISALRANILLPALDSLSAPALESLSFEGCDGSTSFSTSVLGSFFALGPSIKDIRIAGVDLKGEPHHHQASSSTSNPSRELTSLHLSQCYIRPSFFPALFTTSSSSTLYPHLAALTLHNCTHDPADLTAFLSAHHGTTIAPSLVVS